MLPSASLPPLAIEFGPALQAVLGVVAALSGLGIALMGAFAVTDRAWARGAAGIVLGAALVAGGLWLVGVFGH